MTNKEYYKFKLLSIWETGSQFGVLSSGAIVPCSNMACKRCVFPNTPEFTCSCVSARQKWLEATCGVPASKLGLDTQLLVTAPERERIMPRYFAGFDRAHSAIAFYADGKTSWSDNHEDDVEYARPNDGWKITLKDGTPVLAE